ncbi:MAG TPA: hypothetical protein VGH27_34945 [Streptosporangiaceae bacterium]|jgi:hypothetical protein
MRHRPRDVARELVTLLRAQGLSHLYWSACAMLAVLSVSGGLTVWCDGVHLCWRRDGTTTRWPAEDTEGAATRLAELARPGSPSSS